MHPSSQVTHLGTVLTRYRGELPFGIKLADRFSHMYAIGQTGVGKTSLLLNMMEQDLKAGIGFAFLDPHGDAAQEVREVAKRLGREIIYFDPADLDSGVGFNPLSPVPPHRRPLVASGILESFKKIWGATWGPRQEHLFRNALLLLLDQREATLADVSRLFYDPVFRDACVGVGQDAQVRQFWEKEFKGYSQEAIAPIQNKLGALLAYPALRRALCEVRETFQVREVMDEGKVLVVNLSRGRLGPDASSLLGSLLVSRIAMAGLSRSEVAEWRRRPFFCYLDEFQSFTTTAVAEMLAELRKYKVGLVLAHQHLAQLEPEVREAVLGNAGTMVMFRVGPTDARTLEIQVEPQFERVDLAGLPNRRFYMRLMVDGVVARPFGART